MPTLRLAMDMAYELIGWPAQFSEGETAPCFVFGDPEVVQRRLAENGGLFAVGEGYTRSEETWQDTIPPAVEGEIIVPSRLGGVKMGPMRKPPNLSSH